MSSNTESNELLCAAVKTSNCEITSLLIIGGCDVNYVDKNGKSVLLHACEGKIIEQIKFLLEKGAKIDQGKNIDSIFNKSRCVTSVDFEIIKLLIECGADINGINDSNKNKACLLADVVKDNNIDGVIALLSLPQLKIDTHSGNGVTALRIACARGYESIVTLLLNAGANPNIIGDGGSTPFLRSMVYSRCTIVQKLLSHGIIDIKIQDSNGHSALHHAAILKKSGIICQLLMLGADKNLKDNNGKTAVDLCADGESKWVMQNYEKLIPSVPCTAPTMVAPVETPQVAVQAGQNSNSVVLKFIIPGGCYEPGRPILRGVLKKGYSTYQMWNEVWQGWSNSKIVIQDATFEYIVGKKIPFNVCGDRKLRFDNFYINGICTHTDELYC